jgi:hypothetical protein
MSMNYIASMLLVIVGIVIGTVMAQTHVQDLYNNLPDEMKSQFLYDNLTLADRREIAEDWCAINGKTGRVCRNAKLRNPILPPMDAK